MKTRIQICLILLLLLTACKDNSAELTKDEKADIYYNDICNSLDKNSSSEVKIIMTKEGGRNEELILYTYYSNSFRSIIMGVKAANWNREGVEFVSLAEQKSQSLPISFGSVLQENGSGGRIITYGTINDNSIEGIKLMYADKLSVEEKHSGGFIVIRNGFLEGVSQINAYDKDLNEVYKFPGN
ncbi:MAG: hypothetical protein AAGU76_11675 [Sedimentibacter sp.]|uniref:hypothetical protein n=1 Tax=Sedimentibacter sp. TaxID=1960295 RepID=UPI00315911B6